MWDLALGQAIATLGGLDGATGRVAFSADGAVLACGRDDHTIVLWDADTRELLRTLTAHDAWMSDFIAIAKIALEGTQLSEALGILERS